MLKCGIRLLALLLRNIERFRTPRALLATAMEHTRRTLRHDCRAYGALQTERSAFLKTGHIPIIISPNFWEALASKHETATIVPDSAIL